MAQVRKETGRYNGGGSVVSSVGSASVRFTCVCLCVNSIELILHGRGRGADGTVPQLREHKERTQQRQVILHPFERRMANKVSSSHQIILGGRGVLRVESRGFGGRTPCEGRISIDFLSPRSPLHPPFCTYVHRRPISGRDLFWRKSWIEIFTW